MLLKNNGLIGRDSKNLHKTSFSAASSEVSFSAHSFDFRLNPVSSHKWHLHSLRLRRSPFEPYRLSALHNLPAPKTPVVQSTRSTEPQLPSTVRTTSLSHRMRRSPFVQHRLPVLRCPLVLKTIIALTRPTAFPSKLTVRRITMGEICNLHRYA